MQNEEGSGFSIAATKGWGTRVLRRTWADFLCLQYVAFGTVQALALVSQVLSGTSQALKPSP